MGTKLSTKNDKFRKMFTNILRNSAILAIALMNTGFSVDTARSEKAADWDGSFLMKPSVLHETSGYKIWYDGADFDENIQIGLAKSKDGISWKKAPQQQAKSRKCFSHLNRSPTKIMIPRQQKNCLLVLFPLIEYG